MAALASSSDATQPSHVACGAGPEDNDGGGQAKRGAPMRVVGRLSFQAKRRVEALARQSNARRNLNDHIRRLALKGSEREAEDGDTLRVPAAGAAEVLMHADKPRHSLHTHTGTGDFEGARRFYAQQLMQQEWLIEAPSDLATHWYALPRPEGQRCLVVAAEGRTVSRTRSGSLLHTFPSALPGGARGSGGGDSPSGPCILDCVYHEPAATYFVQDLMCWKGYALYDCSAEFRQFWLHTKLAECGAGAGQGPRHRYRFLPLPAYACDAGGLHAALHGAVPFSRDGVTLLHMEGHYALGASPLALLWKDASCSRYHLDTDAAGVVPPRQGVTLQCLPGGGVGTGDEQPTALARLPDAAVQQLGERLRPGRLLRFTVTEGGLQLGPDGCPVAADLHYEGPANQRRAKADTLSKLLFQYRARMQPELSLERMLEEDARCREGRQKSHQGACGDACAERPPDAMAVDAP